MPDIQYIPRLIESVLEKSIDKEIITLILGPRQVGKTTLMNYTRNQIENRLHKKNNQESDKAKSTNPDLSSPQPAEAILNQDSGIINYDTNIFAYNLDDINIRAALKKNINYIQQDIELSLGQSLSQLDKKIYLFIDEVQKYPPLFDWIKQIFDDYSSKIKIFLTGSYSLSIKKNSQETLAGRIEYVSVYPLILGEILQQHNGKKMAFFQDLLYDLDQVVSKLNRDSLDQLPDKLAQAIDKIVRGNLAIINQDKDNINRMMEEHIFYGGLPRLYTTTPEQRVTLINNYIKVYLEKEIASLSKGIDLEMFGLTLRALAQHNGKKLNLNEIAQTTGAARPSLYNYMNLLESTFLIKRVYPLDSAQIASKTTKERRTTIKAVNLYFLDTGILNVLNYTNSLAEMRIRPDYNRVYKTWVLGNINTQFSLLANQPNIYFWQSYKGHKIDFIVPHSLVDFFIIIRRKLNDKKILRIVKHFLKQNPDYKKPIMVLAVDSDNQDLTTYSPKEISKEIDGYKNRVMVFNLPSQVLV